MSTWQQAIATYTQAGDQTGTIRSRINQAQAMRSLGLYRQALLTLTEVNQALQQQPNSSIKATELINLSDVLKSVGKVEQAQQVLQQSLTIAQQLKLSHSISAALISLGNVARIQQKPELALSFYQRSLNASPSIWLKIRAQLNLLNTLIDTGQWVSAKALATNLQPQLIKLPSSRMTLYAQINLAQSLFRLRSNYSEAPTIGEIAQLVALTARQAKALGDQRSEAYALGKLGGLYEQTQQWAIAQDLTQQALVLAQASNASEIAYRWQWQLGRLLKAKGDTQAAIAAYTQAINTLQSLRSDLIAVDQDIQFSFRESVEPVYRELVGLLLQPDQPSQSTLAQARNVLESLRLAELDNFFREACSDAKTTQIDQVDPQAAIVYSIVLADRLSVILSLPNQPLHHYATLLPQHEVEQVVEAFRQNLVIRSGREFMPLSQKLYNWLIRPAETALAKSGVNTLVFVLDGALQNIPMAALHSGKQYLIENYRVALTPSLQLLTPQQLKRENLKVLTAGLTQSRAGFSALDNVELELTQIKSEIPSVVLLDQNFTRAKLQTMLQSNSFPIVHIATHGKFSSKATETFILAWDERININQLETLLGSNDANQRQAIELLVLSACETAIGDKRAALGLAGIAVKAGARSTLATLWSVNDEATANLMSFFYKELTNPQVTKAEALRRAQLALLQDPVYQHPLYWAPFILVGNWL